MSEETGPEVHPEDRKSRLESIADARKRINAFVERYGEDLCQTILTYEDGKAEDLWWSLRERFWSGEQRGVATDERGMP